MNTNNKWRIYRKLEPGEFIVIGADTAAGGIDYCAAQFMSVTKRDVPMVYHAKELASDMTNELMRIMNAIYFDTKVRPVIAYERNNGGVFELERLRKYPNALFDVYRTKTNTGTIRGTQESPKYGWDTNSATRPAMLADLKDAIDNRLFMFYDEFTLREMLSFVIVQTPTSWKPQAETGMHDDLVMALAIAWQLYQTESADKPKGQVVTPEQPGVKPKAPYVDEEGNLVGAGLDEVMAKAVKKTMQPRGRDWIYRR